MIPEPTLTETLRQIQIHIDQAVLVGTVNRFDDEGCLEPAHLPPYVIDHLTRAHALITDLIMTQEDTE